MDLYNNILKVAKEKNISIRELEIQAHLGNGTIGKWRTFEPNLANIKKVANVLKVPYLSLLE